MDCRHVSDNGVVKYIVHLANYIMDVCEDVPS